jgi:DNA (cytosine-5)-methyltransferase 1
MSHQSISNRHDLLILSIFPGIDLLGLGFEEHGFCVVRGPDLITGGDIRDFRPPHGIFSGVIGGSPCQDFSKLNRNPGSYGSEMLDEYCRIVVDTKPEWFLFENVVTAPDFTIPAYTQQRFSLDLAWFSEFSRRRDFVFGSRSGVLLNLMSQFWGNVRGTCVTGSDDRSFSACCEIQGLPADFDIPFFSLDGKKQAVANAVPLPMGRYVAGMVRSALIGGAVTEIVPAGSQRRCACGCGRVVVGRALYHSATCRKRAQRAREAV